MRTAHAVGSALGILVVTGVLLTSAGIASGADATSDAKALFTETHKCNMCHAVPAAGIEAKTKSEAMKGPDLGGKVEADFAAIASYVRKEADKDGKSHKKEFKGTDEELQAIIDWLGSLEAQK